MNLNVCRALNSIAAAALIALSSHAARAAQPFCSGDTGPNGHAETLFYAGANGMPYVLDADGGLVMQWRQIPSLPAVAAGSGMTCYLEPTNPLPQQSMVYVYTLGGQLNLVKLWGSLTGSRDSYIGAPPAVPPAGTFAAVNLTARGAGKPVAPNASPFGYIDTGTSTEFLYYIGNDNHVHVMSGPVGPNLKEDGNLDATTGLPPAVAGSPLTGQFNGSGDEVFYIGADSHIYEVWRWSVNFDGWHLTDLTTANTATPRTLPEAGSPLASFHDSTAGVDSVFYVGTDRHIYETYMAAPVSIWKQLDLTTLTGFFGDFSPGMTGQVDQLISTDRLYLVSNEQVIGFWALPSAPLVWKAAQVSFAAGNGSPVAANGSYWQGFEWVFTTDQNGDVLPYLALPTTGQLSWYFAPDLGIYPSPPPPLY